jgi:N-acetyl-1-D-myo-inositol-2-amino-2-deoxy-alpha-D-glucopyranoside deacetylase
MDTAENHRRLGEIRAGELERAMGVLGVTEWESLGYRDSGMMGTEGNRDPRAFWQADLDDAARRLTWLVRRYQPDVITTYNDFGGYGHPDHIRTHDVAVRAFERAGDEAWYPEQFEDPEIAPWAPAKLYEQAIPASVRERMEATLKAAGRKSFWSPPDDATPEQIAEMEAFAAKMLVPDERVTTWVDVSGDPLQAKWDAIHEHVTQISDESPFMLLGLDGWRDGWANEAYILRETRIAVDLPETDLFAGIA